MTCFTGWSPSFLPSFFNSSLPPTLPPFLRSFLPFFPPTCLPSFMYSCSQNSISIYCLSGVLPVTRNKVVKKKVRQGSYSSVIQGITDSELTSSVSFMLEGARCYPLTSQDSHQGTVVGYLRGPPGTQKVEWGNEEGHQSWTYHLLTQENYSATLSKAERPVSQVLHT